MKKNQGWDISVSRFLLANTSKGSYRSWKKVWMMMMKERNFAGHPSLVLPPLHLASLALALLALNLLIFAPLTLVN